MSRRAVLALGSALVLHAGAAAHLNSPNVYLEEAAGPWPAITVIDMPRAVPGEARVRVRLQDLKPGEAAKVRLLEIPPEGEQAAPGWVEAKVLSADPSTFIAPMPLMTYGVWKARIEVSGGRGQGTIDIPVAAKTPPSQTITRSLAAILLTLAAFLLGTLWLIVRALSRDVYRGAATIPTWARRYLPAGTTLAFLGVLGFHMYAWAQMDAQLSLRNARTTKATLAEMEGAVVAGNETVLRLAVKDTKGRPVTDLVADHGKIMHAVVVKVPEMTYFLHLHPVPAGPGAFDVNVDPPEPGRYEVFADLLYPTGATDTVTANFDAGPGGGPRAPRFADPDDSESTQAAFGAEATGRRMTDVGDGLTMRLVSPPAGPIAIRDLLDIGVELDGPDGKPVDALEPYMGMGGHLLIVRSDFQVFAHVHPMGTISAGMTMPPMHAGMSPEEHAKMMAAMQSRIPGARVSFPFGFPSPGKYRLFVQVKYGGKIRTGVYDLTVG